MNREKFKEYLDKGVRIFQIWGHPTFGSGTFAKYTGNSRNVNDDCLYFHIFVPYRCMDSAWIPLSYIRAIKICPCCEKSLIGCS